MLDGEGRVAQSGRRFLTPTLDEHGGLHIAIGTSYASNGGGIENGGSLSPEDILKAQEAHQEFDGINAIDAHLDITIGDAKTSLVGRSKSGEETVFIENNVWQNF
jgi:leucyl aminopeptidase (aminopeptidase T)